MKKDLNQPVSLSAKSFFGLFINRQSLPMCITVPRPDCKIEVVGFYHFELPSMSFTSDFKICEDASWSFFDNSATVKVFTKQPENRHSCLWQQRAIIVTPFPEPAANAETLWKPANMHFTLTFVISFLRSLWLEASSLLYLSDTHFAQGEEVDGLAEQRRNNSPSFFRVQKTADWIVLYVVSLQQMGLKTLYPGKLSSLPKIS